MYAHTHKTGLRLLGLATIAGVLLGMLPIQSYSAFAQSEEEATEVVGEGSTTGTVIISKEVTDGSTTTIPFSFEVSWGTGFELLPGESVSYELEAAESLTIIESVPDGWNDPEITCETSLDGTKPDRGFALEADETITCTFLNDQIDKEPVDEEEENNEEEEEGGGEEEEENNEEEQDPVTYLVDGYVWHDDNENEIWDGVDTVASTSEDELPGWTVTIADGDASFSTTTDADGYYWFEVVAGTWTITEVVKDGWIRTVPVSGSHEATVPDVEETEDSYNFGNNEIPADSSGGSSSGGGSSAPRCVDFTVDMDGGEITFEWKTRHGEKVTIDADGVEVHSDTNRNRVDEGSTTIDDDGQEEFVLTVSRSIRTDTCEIDLREEEDDGGDDDSTDDESTEVETEVPGPTPQVLGEQVSAVPQGAPSTGAGGTSIINLTTLTSAHFRKPIVA